MIGFVAIVLVVAVVVVVGIAMYAKRRNDQTSRGGADTLKDPAGASSPVPFKPLPLVVEFHVKGDTASAVFSVPLGDSEAGQHLVDLLCATAVEYVREKSLEGLPLDDVARIDVFAMRAEKPEKIGSVELPEMGLLPEPDLKTLVEPTHDPIAAVAKVVADTSVAKPSADSSGLEPVRSLVQLTGPTEAHLRGMGVDPATMSLEDLVLGLLRMSGYDVHVGRQGFTIGPEHGRAAIYGFNRDGKSTVLVTLTHEEGAHPELAERALSEFAVGVAQTRPDQAILVTDKYSPYSMYEMEKRDKRLVFVTRERLQGFVDSFGIQ